MSRTTMSWLGVAIAAIGFVGILAWWDRRETIVVIEDTSQHEPVVTPVGENNDGVTFAVSTVGGHPDWYNAVRSDGRGGWMKVVEKTYPPDNSATPFDDAKAAATDALNRSATRQPAVVESVDVTPSIEIVEPNQTSMGRYNDPFSGQMYTGG